MLAVAACYRITSSLNLVLVGTKGALAWFYRFIEGVMMGFDIGNFYFMFALSIICSSSSNAVTYCSMT